MKDIGCGSRERGNKKTYIKRHHHTKKNERCGTRPSAPMRPIAVREREGGVPWKKEASLVLFGTRNKNERTNYPRYLCGTTRVLSSMQCDSNDTRFCRVRRLVRGDIKGVKWRGRALPDKAACRCACLRTCGSRQILVTYAPTRACQRSERGGREGGERSLQDATQSVTYLPMSRHHDLRHFRLYSTARHALSAYAPRY